MPWARLRFLLAAAMVFACPAASDAQWMVSAYGGAMHTRPAAVRVEIPSRGIDAVFTGTAFDGESWTPPIYYGYRVARAVRGTWLFIEGELIHGKVYMRTGEPLSSLVESFAMSHGLNFVLANVAVRRPLAWNRVMWTARVGAGPVVPHVESEMRGRRREDYQLAGAGMQASGGLDIRLWRALGASAEYKWTYARPHVELVEGTATLPTRSHHGTIGVVFAF